MKLQLVAPRRRARSGCGRRFQVFARQPLGFASLFAACLFVFLLLGLIPFVGTIALLVAAAGRLAPLHDREPARRRRPGGRCPARSSSSSRAGRAAPGRAAQARRRLRRRDLPRLLARRRPRRRRARGVPRLAAPTPRRRRESAAARVADPRLQFGLAAAPGLRSARSRSRSGTRRRSSSGAARAGPSRSSSAASRSGATRARSRSTAWSGSRSG